MVGYGAPGKGNTLLNYCGIRTDFLDFTVDANPYKQGKFTPGTRIPILAARGDPRGAARLRADPAVEPEGRDLAQAAPTSPSGAAASSCRFPKYGALRPGAHRR